MQYASVQYNNLADLVRKNAEIRPDKICIFYKDKTYTYAEAWHILEMVAASLKEHGVRPGDRVGILMENRPEFIFSYLGANSVGAVAVPTNIFLKGHEIAHNLKDCQTRFLFTSALMSAIEKEVLALTETIEHVFSFGEVHENAVNIFDAKYEPLTDNFPIDAPAVILYTSGTTGNPKGAVLTNKNLLHNAWGFCVALDVTEEDRSLLLLPMFHSFCFLTNIAGPLMGGASIIVLESVMDTTKDGYTEMLHSLRPSLLMGVPAVYAAMTRAKVTPEYVEKFPYRVCVSGGAPLPVEIWERFKAVYNVAIIEGYGLSEASPVVCLNPFHLQKSGSVGCVLPELKVNVVDADGNELPTGTPGELCVQGDNVMSAYWNQPAETAKALKNGWLHTGDIATIDEDGFIFIVDRLKDLILVKGINVYPRDIEELLYKYKGVQAAAVVGVSDTEGTEIPVAYVKAEEGIELKPLELKKYLQEHLGGFKVPRRFFITDDIPMNASGKVLRKELRERAKRELER